MEKCEELKNVHFLAKIEHVEYLKQECENLKELLIN